MLALIFIIVGAMGLNIRSLLKEQRFKAETSLVVDTLRLAQDLMLIAESDAHVRFAPDKESGGILYWIELEKPLTKSWIRELVRKRAPLTAIRWVEFEEAQGGRVANQFDLHFLSGGSVMSQGNLRLANADRQPSMQGYICLPGYPVPLVLSNAPCEIKKQTELEKLTFYTQREIFEREQKNALKQ